MQCTAVNITATDSMNNLFGDVSIKRQFETKIRIKLIIFIENSISILLPSNKSRYMSQCVSLTYKIINSLRVLCFINTIIIIVYNTRGKLQTGYQASYDVCV